MITGFNTDIEHEGVVYHVQTEDKGLDSPIILSLVYVGGTILASKRSPYEDLIASGFSDEVLAERLKRQHRLICAAINSGRIDDLKKMSGRPKGAPSRQEAGEAEIAAAEAAPDVETTAAEAVEEPFEIEYWPVSQEWVPPPPPADEELAAAMEPGMEPRYEPVEITPREPEPEPEPVREDVEEELVTEPALEEGLFITLLDDDEFYSGKRYTLRVLVNNRTNGDEKPLANVAVSVKVLGTTFRPLIYTVKTESDGVASLTTDIPQFTSGRAAVLVRAVTKEQAAELRRIIHPAE
ncbi:MAG TPA: hypothetical protein VFS90_10680 [Pyrinomonadaceae bacterium]|nr:hypothetical protein [Pyrinomonadaceae bacterium]